MYKNVVESVVDGYRLLQATGTKNVAITQNCQQFEEALVQECTEDMRVIINDNLSIAKILVAPELIEVNQN